MSRRPPALFRTLLAVVAACLAACAPSTLSRPAILGASASAGFGCEITVPPDDRAVLVDMESVYNAMVPGGHAGPTFLADAGFHGRARQAAVEQVDAAVAAGPSIVIAIDYLFWPVYAGRPAELSGEAVLRDRLDALEQALAQLDRFSAPVIVGDIPDMRAATAHVLAPPMVPPPDQLAAFNARIRPWADARPKGAPALVLPVAVLVRSTQAGATVATSYGPLPAAELVQSDRLHPTARGLAVMLREGLHAVAERGLIAGDDFRTDLDDIAARLPAEALAVDSRREPGLWSLIALKGKMNDFGDAMEKKDCAAPAASSTRSSPR